MHFSVGDKVVHPSYGPGEIVGVERKALSDEAKRYYVIEIPACELTVYVPWRTAGDVGVRPAMSGDKRSRMIDTLRTRPELLPDDYRERQEQVWAKLRTGRVLLIAQVVRDLTWHRMREHLTKKDNEYLEKARARLAGEMALVSGVDPDDAEQTIDAVLSEGLLIEEKEGAGIGGV
ncbi:MAG: hypothetical protein JXA93_08515 [Anaerolineae bacterium]|nr:hypothetical protein [Anaerolineae bacterium]